jgi:hypothetical protein
MYRRFKVLRFENDGIYEMNRPDMLVGDTVNFNRPPPKQNPSELQAMKNYETYVEPQIERQRANELANEMNAKQNVHRGLASCQFNWEVPPPPPPFADKTPAPLVKKSRKQ